MLFCLSCLCLMDVLFAQNIALGKPTFQSSTQSIRKHGSYIYGNSSKAVDGNKKSHYFDYQSCICTKYEFNPWWADDLGKTLIVDKVRITNRGDCCHIVLCKMFSRSFFANKKLIMTIRTLKFGDVTYNVMS